MEQRGFDVDELYTRWNVSYCEADENAKPKLWQRIVIPFYDSVSTAASTATGEDGQRLVGWQARVVGVTNATKYLTAAGTHKSHVLYGLTQVCDGDGPVVLVEGPTDVWRLGHDAVAILGKDCSHRQRQKLLEIAEGRPIAIALDPDAATETQRVREQLLADRQQVGDLAPVNIVKLPDGRDDIGDCTRDEAWTAVTRRLNADSNRFVSRHRTSSGVEFDVIDGMRVRLNATTLRRIGDSVVVLYGVSSGSANSAPPLIVGTDQRVLWVAPGQARILGQLGNRKRIYTDSIRAIRIEQQNPFPVAADFEDLRIIAHLTGDKGLMELVERGSILQGAVAIEHGKGRQQSNLDTLVELAQDVRQAWGTGEPLQRVRDMGLHDVYEKIEKPVVAPTAAMIENGIRVDAQRLEQLVNRTKRDTDRLQHDVDQSAGAHVNVGSQLKQSTHQLALRLRQAICPEDGRIHGCLNPLGTATGRFSCTSPNLLAIPVELREVFIAAPQHEFIELDASQIELRVLAHFTQSRELLQAFERGTDLHRLTAAHVFGIKPQQVSDSQRRVGKGVNFAILYGQTAMGLAAKLGVTSREAQGYIDRFFQAYMGVRPWIERTQKEAAENGSVRTLYGRRRSLPGVTSSDIRTRNQALRQAVNSVIQGTAADIHKLAVARVFAELPSDCHMLLPVHDSLLIEIPKGHRRQLTKLFCDAIQQTPSEFSVPIKVTVGYGRNWRECSSGSHGPSTRPAQC